MLQATLTASCTATLQPPVLYPRWVRVRHSGPFDGMRGWTSDNLQRQLSRDTLGMKDHPFDDPARIVQIGLPDQIKYMPDTWVKLNRRRQEWLFDVLCISRYGTTTLTAAQLKTAKAEFAEYLDDGRCFTNKAGTDTRHDYINGTNTAAPDMEWEPLVCGDNFVELTGRTQNIVTSYLNFGVKPYLHYEIRAVDPDNLPNPSAFLFDAAVCHTPTTIQPTGLTGRFPQWDGFAKYPIWGSGGKAWIWAQVLELV